MRAFFLRARAPFAAFRWMQAGVYRATSPVIPPSAAWGLLLNIAAIETRSTEPGATTGVRDDVPRFELAVGEVRRATKASLYQQLHGYPVGGSGKELAARSHGSKYWIAPARRELLVDFDCVLAVRASDELYQRVARGLAGGFGGERYGLPFAGDNNLLFDELSVHDTGCDAFWYERVDDESAPRSGSCRLTVEIDRHDSSRTRSSLFAPSLTRSSSPPAAAWTWVPRQ